MALTPSNGGAAKLVAFVNRAAFQAIVIGLLSGIAFHLMAQPHWSAVLLSWTCGILLALPVVNLMGVLADEIRRRDWTFAGLALAVVALLVYALVSKR